MPAVLIKTGHHELRGPNSPSVFFTARFREAAESPPQFGDRRSYQMDYAQTQMKRCLRLLWISMKERTSSW